MEGEAAQEPWTEYARLEGAGGEVDRAEMAGAGVEHPKPAAMPTRRMRHRQSLGDDPVGANFDDRPAFGAPVAPAIDDVAAAHSGDRARFAIEHGHTVQVAAILGGQLGYEGRLPIELDLQDPSEPGVRDGSEQAAGISIPSRHSQFATSLGAIWSLSS
jgi:hypothetical protein